MQYKCRVTVIDKKCFPELQRKYLADPKSGECPFYSVGDTFLFERYGDEDTFWREGNGTQCAEAWDCISRYIYTALQGGSSMRNWTNDEHMMIACCNDGTRPVIFKIERLDYKVVKFSGADGTAAEEKVRALAGVLGAQWRAEKDWLEVFTDRNAPVSDEAICGAVSACGGEVTAIE